MSSLENSSFSDYKRICFLFLSSLFYGSMLKKKKIHLCSIWNSLLSSHSPVFDFLELQRRYRTLLVPSDFLAVHLSWLSAFPVSQPFSLHHPSRIQVSSEKESAADAGAEPPPTDSDPTYSSKVSWLGSCHLIPLLRAEKTLKWLLHAFPIRYCCSPPRDWRNCIVVACCSWMTWLSHGRPRNTL